MGIWEKLTDPFREGLEREFGFAPPTEPGYDSVHGVRAMRDGKVKVFMGVAGNFARAMSDSAVTEDALRRLRLTVQVSTKLNRSHTVCGETALILPTLGRSDRDVQATGEQFVTVENSMSQVHTTRGRLDPASPHLLSEVAIICRLARRTLGEENAIPWEDFEGDYSLVRDRISRVVPGFRNFNERVVQPGGFRLGSPVNEGVFATASGKAEFSCNDFTSLVAPAGHLMLQTVRSHDQWNTVPYAMDDRYRGIHDSRHVVLVNPDDLAELDLEDQALVDVVSVWEDGSERRLEGFRAVSYPTARGSAAAYYPEANALVPLDSVAEASNTPTYKGIVVRLQPHASGGD
jgi:molybdopterin-dependent oxidoreductase alpha subunit